MRFTPEIAATILTFFAAAHAAPAPNPVWNPSTTSSNAGEWAGPTNVVPVPSPSGSAGGTKSSGKGSPSSFEGYKCYSGNPNEYPGDSEWMSSEKLWELNRPIILKSNGGNKAYADALEKAIKAVAKAKTVDDRTFLVTAMQESTGKVDVECTGVQNCGPLQGPPGITPFSAADPEGSLTRQITQVYDGVPDKDGLDGAGIKRRIDRMKDKYPNYSDSAYIFFGKRDFNSGQNTNLMKDGKVNLNMFSAGKESYVNDIANRLRGWLNAGDGSYDVDCKGGQQAA